MSDTYVCGQCGTVTAESDLTQQDWRCPKCRSIFLVRTDSPLGRRIRDEEDRSAKGEQT